MTALPRSLQSRISDAKSAVASWDDDEDGDEVFQAVKDWTVRLSRGEYDQNLYWECVAEDCESVGDWDGAKAAYRKRLTLDSSKRGDVHAMKACTDLGHLYFLLGDDRSALSYFHEATEGQRLANCAIFYRCCLVTEARQLLRMQRVNAAARLMKKGFASFTEGHDDHLGHAKLHILQAACDVERCKSEAAASALQVAWDALEQLAEFSRDAGSDDEGSGVHAAFAWWWRTEARRREIAGEGAQEVDALRQSLERTRRGAVGWDKLGWNAPIILALQQLAEACDRHGQAVDAADARAEAEEIRRRWHLPESGPAQPGPTDRWSLRRLFRKRN